MPSTHDKYYDSTQLKLKEEAFPLKNFVAFWLLGFLNNFLYVVNNAGAHNISPHGIGLTYLSGIFPTMVVKLTAPYWFHLVSYKTRIIAAGFFMTLCLLMVGWIPQEYGKWRLTGVAMSSIASGIGESSCLALATSYDAHKMLIAWASGTGFAGIGGFAWSKIFKELQACYQMSMTVGLWVPAAWLFTFFVILDRPALDDIRADNMEAVSASVGQRVNKRPASDFMTSSERFIFILGLWPYMIPLFTVYASEYAMQAGTWAAIGFPVHDAESRTNFYQWAGTMYQVGVFISRSLGGVFVVNRPILWFAPFMQCVFLVAFTLIAMNQWGEFYLLMIFALITGFLGGFTYVAAFVLINHEVDENYREFALGSASVADSMGILTADVGGILIQGCLFGYLEVLDIKPVFSCGYDIWEESPPWHAAAPAPFCFPGVEGPSMLTNDGHSLLDVNGIVQRNGFTYHD